MEGLVPGRIVHFVISDIIAEQINRRRTNGLSIKERMAKKEWPIGAQAHIGNHVEVGEHYPMIITKVWDKNKGVINGQVFLDGNDVFWAQSCTQDDKSFGKYSDGTWHWIERE